MGRLREELACEKASERTRETIERVQSLLEQYRFNEAEWRQYASFTANKYTRNLVGYDEKFTLLLLCWPAGLASPVHDHAEASCWMKILSGSMREVRYRFPGDDDGDGGANGRDSSGALDESQLEQLSVTDLKAESAAYIDDSRGLHKFGNASASEPSVSLHIYSPPFDRCRVFDERSGAGREVSLKVRPAAPCGGALALCSQPPH